MTQSPRLSFFNFLHALSFQLFSGKHHSFFDCISVLSVELNQNLKSLSLDDVNLAYCHGEVLNLLNNSKLEGKFLEFQFKIRLDVSLT